MKSVQIKLIIISLLALAVLSACTVGSMGPNGSLSLTQAISDGVVPNGKIALFQRAVWMPPRAHNSGILGAIAITDQMVYFIIWDETGQKYRRTWTVERSKIVDVSIERVGLSKWANIYNVDGFHTVFAVPGEGSALPDGDATEQIKTILISK